MLEARKRRILIWDSRVLTSSVKASIECMLKYAVAKAGRLYDRCPSEMIDGVRNEVKYQARGDQRIILYDISYR